MVLKNAVKGWAPLLVAFLFLSLAACNSDDRDDRAQALEEPPAIFLVAGEQRIEGLEVASCWPEYTGGTVDLEATGEDPVNVCEDTALPTFEQDQFITLPAGEPLRVALEEPLPDRVSLVLAAPDDMSAIHNEDEVPVENNVVTWEPDEAQPGDYVLAVLGFWEDAGGVTYYFPVTLEE